jgi:hypothetical protein
MGSLLKFRRPGAFFFKRQKGVGLALNLKVLQIVNDLCRAVDPGGFVKISGRVEQGQFQARDFCEPRVIFQLAQPFRSIPSKALGS